MTGPSAPHRSHARGGAPQRGRRLPSPPLRVWVWTAAALALVVVAALLWRGSDAAATESTTAPPAGAPSGAPAGAVSEQWAASGGPLPEDVVEGGRVILGSPHGVRALDPASGEEVWHYTRSNARLCDLAATDGVVVAVFRTADRCDEAVALRAGTGVRAWTRNVSFAGDVTLDSTDRIVLAATPTGLVTLDPTGNGIRWRYAPPAGCRILASEVGSAGVAVVQGCTGATVVSLRLLDGFDGNVHWTRELPAADEGDVHLLGADRLLVLHIGDEVHALSREDGALLTRLPVPEGAEAEQVSSPVVTLVRVGGTLSALDPDSGAVLWEAPAQGLPAPPAPAKQIPGRAVLLVPEAGGFAHRDPLSGAETARSVAEGVPPGGVAASVGPVVVLRLGDRVLAFS